MGYCTFYSIKNGHPEKMFSPSNGNLLFCGIDNNGDLSPGD